MAVVGLGHPPKLNLHIQLPATPKSIEPCHAPLHLPTNTTIQEVDSLSDLETLEVLGNGSGGRVYKVRHSRTLAVYALKVIPCYPPSKQVLREIEIFSSTDSPFVVGYRGVFQNSSGEIAILMEYMDAGTLDNLVKTNGSFTEAMIANIASQGLKGLSYIHEKKIVHQDIKPSNLLVSQKMEVKIADFGVSRMVNISHDPCDACAGTCAYMSPEQFDSETFGASNGFAGDVWSLGLTLVELYKGYYPYLLPGTKLKRAELMWEICFGEPPSLPEDTSENFRDFIGCCLQKESSKRWTVSQLLCHPFVTNGGCN